MLGDVQAVRGRDVLENARRDCWPWPISALRLAQASPRLPSGVVYRPLTAYVNPGASIRSVRLPDGVVEAEKNENRSVVLVWN